jgi:O-antigen/teichoic acid export membrane protein
MRVTPEPCSVAHAAEVRGASDAAPAPLGGWGRVARDGLYVGGATAIGHVLAAATSLMLRFLLDPAEMGIWQGLKLVLGYANYTNLGTSKAAARELAIARGRGDVSRARRSINLAFTFNTLTSSVYALVVLVVAASIAVWGDGPWRWAWCGGLAAMGLLAVLQRHVTFLVTLLRSLQAFALTSQVAVLEAVLTLTAAGSAAWWLGLPGLYGASLVVLVGALVWMKRGGAPSLDWAWNVAELQKLIAIGGPMLLVGLLTALFRSLDKLLILACLDDREFQLGCYSLAILATTQLTGVASMLSIVMGPRLAEMLGHAEDQRAAARLAARTIELQAVIMTAAGVLMIVAAPPFFSRVLPEYRDGLTALVIRTPGLIAFGLTLPLSQYLVAVDQQGRALVALGVAVILAAIAGACAVGMGWGLAGIAAAMTLADLTQLALLAGLSLTGVLARREWTRLFAATTILVGPALAVALAWETAQPSARCGWPTVAIKLATVLGISAACGLLIWRFGGWRRVQLREALS